MPIVAIDFSMANMTFNENLSLHSTKPEKQNDYRDLLNTICYSYSNVLQMPIFGYGAKTISRAATSASLIPLSIDLRNPFVSNEVDVVN